VTASWLDDAEAAIETEHAEQEAIGEANTWSPEAGDLLKGKLIGVKYINTKFGWTYLIHVMDAKEQVWDVWCGRTVLKNRLLEEAPALGKGIAIKYHGMKEGKEFKFHDYTLSAEPQDADQQKASFAFFHALASAESAEDVKEITQTASEAAGLDAPF